MLATGLGIINRRPADKNIVKMVRVSALVLLRKLHNPRMTKSSDNFQKYQSMA